jgi:hypothetical protein
MSGYVPANVQVIMPGQFNPEPNQIGAASPPLPDEPFSETNSGIAICFDIKYAKDHIDEYLKRQQHSAE